MSCLENYENLVFPLRHSVVPPTGRNHGNVVHSSVVPKLGEITPKGGILLLHGGKDLRYLEKCYRHPSVNLWNVQPPKHSPVGTSNLVTLFTSIRFSDHFARWVNSAIIDDGVKKIFSLWELWLTCKFRCHKSVIVNTKLETAELDDQKQNLMKIYRS